MRIRTDIEANYKAVFNEGKTIRMRIDPSKPILAPKTAEIEDVAINSKCFANCSYCYTSATKHGSNFEVVIDKALEVWGYQELNERPFQIAIGGAGEPTIHPDFTRFLAAVESLEIVPNYTTNGMHLTNSVLRATAEYCGGVAISYHPHLAGKVFYSAIKALRNITRLNTHVIVGDKSSFFDLQDIYKTYKDDLEYIVVLPYQAVGRGVPVETYDTWTETFKWIAGLPEERQKQFAFGALFYPWLLENQVPLAIDTYEPEIYSGYRIMDDSYNILRKSSYNLEPK